MPYIKQERRRMIDPIIDVLSKKLDFDGDLNYVLFRLAKNVKPSYNNYKNFLGELHEAEMEIRRRLLVPYEQEKIEKNGDVE